MSSTSLATKVFFKTNFIIMYIVTTHFLLHSSRIRDQLFLNNYLGLGLGIKIIQNAIVYEFYIPTSNLHTHLKFEVLKY